MPQPDRHKDSNAGNTTLRMTALPRIGLPWVRQAWPAPVKHPLTLAPGSAGLALPLDEPVNGLRRCGPLFGTTCNANIPDGYGNPRQRTLQSLYNPTMQS